MKNRKKFLLPVFIVCMMTMFCSAIHAQKEPGYLPGNGFWIIVTNNYIKKQAIVRFYDNNKQLIYEEKVTGRHLRISKRKILFCLNQCLEKAIAASNNDQSVLAGNDLLISLLNNRK